MADSAQTSNLEQARAADTNYLTRRSMTKGYELFSLLTPPLYTAYVLLRKPKGHFNVNRLLRATWLGGATGTSCIAAGGAFGYARAVSTSPETLRHRRVQAMYDADAMRTDDHATIGALLFALLAPATFWKRATTIHLIFGGAGLGTGVGMITHWVRHVTGDPAPHNPIPEALLAPPPKN
ncbi:hypothetical protein PENSPDRAFT_641962 [Peniophora sp. CONT]|nr:hypothetical protein PENSPDRAFT_641962 [Peniophora sp. CONT]